MRTPRPLLLTGLLLLVAGLVWAVRYTDRTSDRLASTIPSAPGGKPTIRLARNPAPVPAFSAVDIGNRPVDTASWSGRVTLLNFWATWCGPCRAEIPDLIELQQKYSGRLQVIGIADDSSPEVVRQYAAEFGINYPNVMLNSEIRSQFRVRAIPTTYVIDPQGRVVQRHVGQINTPVVEQEIRALLDLPVDAVVERFDDIGQISARNASQVTEIPGLDLDSLPPDRRAKAVVQLNTDKCTCGCGLTVAECRIDDPTCAVSGPIAEQIVERWRNGS
jgi:thiol-disulfide isomerase/thioredoxin